MLPSIAAAVLLGLAAPALAAPFDRVNDDECVAGNDEVDFASLAKGLNDSGACTGGDQCEFKATFATDFSIEYYDNFKIVTNTYNETSPYVAVLYPCGTQQPGPNAIQPLLPEAARVGYFAVPLTAVATADSTAGWALEALGLEDRVRFVNFATAPCMMKVMAPQNATFGGCGRDFVADNDYDENAVPTPLEEFDAEFKFSPADPELKQIPFTASADPSPLARVQHLVYMGAFFNAEARATARVQEIANAYRMASAPAPNGPMVVWASRSSFLFGYADSDGNPFPPDMAPDHFTFSYARYKTQLTSDAGGQMLPAADVEEVETSGAMALEGATSAGQEVKFIVALYDSEAAMLNLLQPLLKRVDVFIYDGTPPENGTMGFMAEWGIPEGSEAMYPFLANDKLFAHDKDKTADFLDDWFGEAVLRPDIVLKDMRKAIGGDGVLPNHKPTFFRNLAAGEEQTVATGGACNDLTCQAYSNQEALPIAELAAQASASAPAPAGDVMAPGATEPAPSSAAPVAGLAAGAVALVAALAM